MLPYCLYAQEGPLFIVAMHTVPRGDRHMRGLLACRPARTEFRHPRKLQKNTRIFYILLLDEKTLDK